MKSSLFESRLVDSRLYGNSLAI